MSSDLPPDDIVDAEIVDAVDAEPDEDSAAPINAYASQNTPSIPETEDRYLHPLSVIFSLVDLIKQNIIPAFLGIFGAAKGDLIYVGLALLFFVPTFIFALIRYFTIRYRISDGELVVQEGLIFRRVRTVPVERIQNIDMVQGILHRMLNLAEVRVETASGTKPEAVLKVLSLDEMERLREGVKLQKRTSQAASLDAAPGATLAHPDSNAGDLSPVGSAASELLLKIPISWLAKAGFASNRGFVLVGLMLGFYFQFAQGNPGDINAGDLGLWNFIPDNGSPLVKAGVIAAGLAVGLVLLRLLGIGWYILRFFGYELRQVGDDFKISCGLLTKVSATVPRKRIQFISVHRGLIMRWMKLAAVRIETAGGAADDSENATTTVSRRWFIPVLPESSVAEMIAELRPGIDLNMDGYQWIPLAKRAQSRFIRIACVVSCVIVAATFLTFGWQWAIAALIAFPILIFYAIRKSQSVKYARTESGVVYRSGVLAKKTSFSFFEKIQAASWRQTPFDRRWQMATLSVDTAAAGPAEHVIDIKYLDQEIAKEEYEQIVALAAAR